MLGVATSSTEAVKINLMQVNRFCGEEPASFGPIGFGTWHLYEVETFQVIINRINMVV